MKCFKPFVEQIPISLLTSDHNEKYHDLESIEAYKGKLSPCEADIIAAYMAKCTMLKQWLSPYPSPFDPRDFILSRDWTDGVYYWNELTLHCIKKYHIRLPSDFKKHVYQQLSQDDTAYAHISMTEREIESLYKELNTKDVSLYDISYHKADDYSSVFADTLVIPVKYSKLRATLYNLSVVEEEVIKPDGSYALTLLIDRRLLVKHLNKAGLTLSDHKYPYNKPFVYPLLSE